MIKVYFNLNANMKNLIGAYKTGEFRLELKGATAVFVDWANVYGWKKSLKRVVDSTALFEHLRTYREIEEIGFYFGTDTHPLSKEQINIAKKAGYRTVTKPVKYLPHKTEDGKTVWVRKCDFDLEIGLDCFERLNKFDCFIFLSGDGDFATLYKRLILRKKQVIVVFASGHLGKEIRLLKKGIFLCVVKNFGTEIFGKKYPPTVGRGRD